MARILFVLLMLASLSRPALAQKRAKLTDDYNERTEVTSYRIMFGAFVAPVVIIGGLLTFFIPTENMSNGLFNAAAYPKFALFVCVEQFAQILSPNAFTPNGKNPEFKPVLFFAEGADYQMVIYDRWGQLLFESTDARIGWQGKGKNGQTLPQGVYVYQIRVTQTSGHIAEKKGTVVLLK